jgi:hypothetical protein
LVRRSRVYVAGVLLFAALAGLLLSPYFIVDAILVTYLALFVGAMALTKGEFPAWVPRNRPSPRSKVAYYSRWMKAGQLDSNVMKTLSPFMKAVVSERDRQTISEERLRALRETTQQPAEERGVSSNTRR